MATVHQVEEITVEWTAGGTDYAQALAGLGVVEATLVEAVRGGDSLALTVERAVDAEPLWTRNQRIRLRNAAGQIVWHGWAEEPAVTLGAASERHEYTFSPATRFLQGTYTQSAYYIDGTTTDPRAAQQIASVILNRKLVFDPEAEPESSVSVDQIRVVAQVADILTQAQTLGSAGAIAPFTFSLTGLTDFDVPMNRRSAISRAEALSLQLMWDPATDWHWDQRGAAPVLRLARYDLGAEPPTVTGADYLAVRTMPNDGTILEGMQPQALDGKLCSKVTIVYAEQTKFEGSDRYTTLYSEEIATADNGSPVELVMQVDLTGPNYGPDGTFGNPEAKPSEGFAARVMNATRRVLWQFGFCTATTGNHWEWRIGDLWNATGLQAAMGEAYSTCVRITRDLVTGRVQVDTGAPSFLSMDDLLAILRITRAAQTPPTPEQAGEGAGWGPVEPVGLGDPDDDEEEDQPPSTAPEIERFKAGGKWQFRFKLPAAWGFAVGTVTALAAGSTPTIDFDGSTSDTKTVNFGLTSGADGSPGADGPPGSDGSDGAPGDADAYTPAVPGDWAGTAPTTIAEALDRIAAGIGPV